MENKEKKQQHLQRVIDRLLRLMLFLLLTNFTLLLIIVYKPDIKHWFVSSKQEVAAEAAHKLQLENWKKENASKAAALALWTPKETSSITDVALAAQVAYGKELIVHTARYVGPKGSVSQRSNGMNCQNCHAEAGTKAWGNNYGAVHSTYPKYRARSGAEEDIYKRINDCFERSLNGEPLALQSKEMQAIKAYIEFIGSDVTKGEKPKGSGIFELPFLSRAADPTKGKKLYIEKCQSCHQSNGQGLLATDKIEYTYPPLWGKNSYNHGAGLYRLSRMAGFIKYNMPQGATFLSPLLTDEESWDIAAFVNSQPRPSKDLSKDWPQLEEKPVDHPFGPYADAFSEKQHKFGAFQPIKDAQKLNSSK